ncbi:MAG TPA: polysaccharide deacetylase family protein [Blastocatellia bacterium]|nr:polysaccharide deacetylase family protein [Blastocatellia bacterium]
MKRRIGYLVALIALAILGATAFWQISKSRTFQLFGEIVPGVKTSQKAVALTFDDGPAPGATDEILAILDEAGVKATFFLIGAELEQHLAEGKKIVAAGHELGNHSYSHDRMLFKSPSFIRQELERTDQLIRATGYQGAIHFRAPFGKKFLLLPWYLSKTGRKDIMWDVEPESFSKTADDHEKITSHVLTNARPGSIILLHVMYKSRSESLRSVKGIIAGLKNQGYSFKTVSELLAMAD